MNESEIRQIIREEIQRLNEAAGWTAKGSKSVTIKGGYGEPPIKAKAKMYVPKSGNPYAKKIGMVGVVEPPSSFTKSEIYPGGFYFGNTGYIGDALKKAFGFRLRGSSAFDYKDLGKPIGRPGDEARKSSPKWVVVFGVK